MGDYSYCLMITIPFLDKFLFRDDPAVINISDEMSKTALWRNLLITADHSKEKESSFPSKRFEY